MARGCLADYSFIHQPECGPAGHWLGEPGAGKLNAGRRHDTETGRGQCERNDAFESKIGNAVLRPTMHMAVQSCLSSNRKKARPVLEAPRYGVRMRA